MSDVAGQVAHADAYYCYGVIRRPGYQPTDPSPAAVRGIADGAVELVGADGADGLLALVSAVPSDEFDADALRANLERLEWLDSVAHNHDSVVDWASRRAPTVPFRLATIYRDRDRVRDVLREHAADLRAALDRVDGRVELGLKVYAAAGSPDRADPPEDEEASGRAYLRRRLEERRTRDAAWDRAAASADEVDHALSDLADDRRQHRPQSPQLSGTAEPNLRNIAYLVRTERVAEFFERADQLRESTSGCRLVVTGPWAAYSFAAVDTESSGATT